jgi:hypothetical protein
MLTPLRAGMHHPMWATNVGLRLANERRRLTHPG